MKRLPKNLSLLKLDIDGKVINWDRVFTTLARAGYRLDAYSYLRTRRGWHLWIAVTPSPRTPMEVVALQAILGSDPMREACNLMRARKWWRTPEFARSWWNVLYRPRHFSRFLISYFGDSNNERQQGDSDTKSVSQRTTRPVQRRVEVRGDSENV